MNDKAPLPDRRLLLDSIHDYLGQLREEGLEGLPLKEGAGAPASGEAPAGDAAKARAATRSRRLAESTDAPAPPSGTSLAAASRAAASSTASEMFSRYPGLEKTADLPALREFIGDCRRCKLWPTRTHIVFGVGNPNAELMFVGEGPGADEDARGEPFVGRAGQLLTEIIERGMGMKRSEVYICNVVKCRPPGNRNPEPDEVAACEPFLLRQIELVRPRVIVALGTFAVQSLLEVKTPISKLRGVWHDLRGTRMMPTFHPAYLLRNPADKRLVWQDIQEVMKALGRRVPQRGGKG
jgi:uracil-DNA glycosylase